jgi:thiol:disulfide interchange protein
MPPGTQNPELLKTCNVNNLLHVQYPDDFIINSGLDLNMHPLSRKFLGPLLASFALLPLSAAANPGQTDHLQVALVSPATSITPGQTLTVGVHFEIEAGWHLYWKNPGDSGEAPRFKWTLPAGFTAGPTVWPAPRAMPMGPLLNYGYEKELLLPVTIQIPAGLPPEWKEGSELPIEVAARWLVCHETCIPGQADLKLLLPIRMSPAPANEIHAALFNLAEQEQPKRITARVTQDSDHFIVDMNLDEAVLTGKPLVQFFPYESLLISHAAKQAIEFRKDGISLQLKVDDARDEPAQKLSGLIVIDGPAPRRTFDFDETIVRAKPQAAIAATKPVAAAPAKNAPGFLMVLLLAFAGGLILNLMPCVFPVLSLKILGVVRHTHDARAARRDGWAYTLGVLVSFWSLAGMLLILRAGSAKLGWGFQLQSPGFIAILAVLMTLVALNLLGVFEIGIGLTRLGSLGGITPGGSAPTPRKALIASFVTGALAVIVATPCTAPFMGPAIGFALTQNAMAAMAIFTSVALGMASPYALLGYFPRVLARMPRPGKWMEHLRQVLAFPMFGTALWLVAVYSQLTDSMSAFKVMGALLVLALGSWIYGRYQQSDRKPFLLMLLALGVSATGVVFATQTPDPSTLVRNTNSGDGTWEAWSSERVNALRAEGRPVFVNFTAAWCISCKANEVTVFQTEEVRQAFASLKVATLKGDWTQQDDTIAAELESHGRAGVPLYLYYAPGSKGPPTALPSVLTKGIVLAALEGK